jgi:hypothetical protein
MYENAYATNGVIHCAMVCQLRTYCSCLLDVEAVWRTERDLECTKNESVRLNPPKNVSGEKAKQRWHPTTTL